MIYKIEIQSIYFNNNLFDNGRQRLLYQLIHLSGDWYYQSLEDNTCIFHFVKDIDDIKALLELNNIPYELFNIDYIK